MSYQILTLVEILSKIDKILVEIPEEKKKLVRKNLTEIFISHNEALRQVEYFKKAINDVTENVFGGPS